MDPLAPLPPDPYKALGVPRDCDQSVIKSTYRKLVLKCHPDKVTDESLKKQKEEEFHKIQAAWELIGDEKKRNEYDGLVTKQRIAREEFAKGGGRSAGGVSVHYEVRTQAPAGASYRTTTATPRYEEHKPASRSYDDRYEERSRKYDGYDFYSKHTSSRSSREKEPTVKVRVSSDRTRSDHKKSRDREERSERQKRFVQVESDSDEYQRFEHNYAKRSDEERRRKEDDDLRRKAAQAREKADTERRSYEDTHDRQRKLSDLQDDAVRYMHRLRGETEWPSPTRTSSSRDVPREYESRSRRDRPDTVRRSSARPSKDRPSSSGRDRDRRGPMIVDWEDDDRKMPSFKHSSSSPADLHVPRMTPQRSYTDSSRDHRRVETPPSPPFRHAETTPSVPHASSSRRKEAAVPRSSSLRESATPQTSGSTNPGSYPTVPPPSNTTKYYYPTPEGGVRLGPEDVGAGRRTVIVEPGRFRQRSPSPLSRPPMGANRPVETTAAYATAAPNPKIVTPSLGRSQSYAASDGRLYGELESDYTRREATRRQTSFDPNKVSYSAKIGPEDIRWAPRGRDTFEKDRDYPKPSFNRTATYVY